jgi:hypothetical protein
MKWTTYTPEQQEVIKELVVVIYHEFFYNQIYFDNWEEFVLELAEIIKNNHTPVSLVDRHYSTDFVSIKKVNGSEIRYRQEKLE